MVSCSVFDKVWHRNVHCDQCYDKILATLVQLHNIMGQAVLNVGTENIYSEVIKLGAVKDILVRLCLDLSQFNSS